MAVYNLTNNNNTYGGVLGKGGVLDVLGSYLLAPALQRAAAAQQFKYDQQLLGQKAALAQEAELAKIQAADNIRRGYIDMLREGAGANPNQLPGFADFIGGAIGSGANLKDLQPYWLPSPITVNQGNQTTVAPMWQNGGIGEGTSYATALSPKETADLALQNRQAAFNEEMARANLGLRQAAAARAAAGGGGAPSYRFLSGYTDPAGNPVMMDRSGNVRSIPGIVPQQQAGRDPLSTMQALATIAATLNKGGGNDPNGNRINGGGEGKSGVMDAIEQAIVNLLNPPSQSAPIEWPEGIGATEAPFYSNALSGYNTGAAPAPKQAGGAGKTLSMATIRQQAAKSGASVEDIKNAAIKRGYTILP